MKLERLITAIVIGVCWTLIANATPTPTTVWESGQFNDSADKHGGYALTLNGNGINADGNIVIGGHMGVSISLSGNDIKKLSLLIRYELPDGGAPVTNAVIAQCVDSSLNIYGAFCANQGGSAIEGWWKHSGTVSTGYSFGAPTVSSGDGYAMLSCCSPTSGVYGTMFYVGKTIASLSGGTSTDLQFSRKTLTSLAVGGPTVAGVEPWEGMVIKGIALFVDEFLEASDIREYYFQSAPPAVAVVNVKCQQQYPWNGKVDIDYEVVADDPDADVWVYATGFDKDSNQSMGVRAISGDGANAPVKPGKHRMTWDVTADYPGFNSTAFTVKMTAITGGAPYMVIDLSEGVDAHSYPVTYLSSVPAGGWSDEYKTTKLVLRLIPPGTFMMGSPTDELGRQDNETLHQVTITKPYYIGIFEVTQKHWNLVMGSGRPGAAVGGGRISGDLYPAHDVSYDDIRGTVNGAAWPMHNQVDANSFMGRLRSKVNMMFDLPTEAQWEYACRAGTSTALNSGKNLTTTGSSHCVNLEEVAWYYSRSGNYPTTVGRFLENAWGLYDMHGNVVEWCRDWLQSYLGSGIAIDPIGPASGSSRVLRGGSYSYNGACLGYAEYCRSAARRAYGPDKSCTGWNSAECFGFRVACYPAE